MSCMLHLYTTLQTWERHDVAYLLVVCAALARCQPSVSSTDRIRTMAAWVSCLIRSSDQEDNPTETWHFVKDRGLKGTARCFHHLSFLTFCQLTFPPGGTGPRHAAENVIAKCFLLLHMARVAVLSVIPAAHRATGGFLTSAQHVAVFSVPVVGGCAVLWPVAGGDGAQRRSTTMCWQPGQLERTRRQPTHVIYFFSFSCTRSHGLNLHREEVKPQSVPHISTWLIDRAV